jgi:hypothetical protein
MKRNKYVQELSGLGDDHSFDRSSRIWRRYFLSLLDVMRNCRGRHAATSRPRTSLGQSACNLCVLVFCDLNLSFEIVLLVVPRIGLSSHPLVCILLYIVAIQLSSTHKFEDWVNMSQNTASEAPTQSEDTIVVRDPNAEAGSGQAGDSLTEEDRKKYLDAMGKIESFQSKRFGSNSSLFSQYDCEIIKKKYDHAIKTIESGESAKRCFERVHNWASLVSSLITRNEFKLNRQAARQNSTSTRSTTARGSGGSETLQRLMTLSSMLDPILESSQEY